MLAAGSVEAATHKAAHKACACVSPGVAAGQAVERQRQLCPRCVLHYRYVPLFLKSPPPPPQPTWLWLQSWYSSTRRWVYLQRGEGHVVAVHVLRLYIHSRQAQCTLACHGPSKASIYAIGVCGKGASPLCRPIEPYACTPHAGAAALHLDTPLNWQVIHG